MRSIGGGRWRAIVSALYSENPMLLAGKIYDFADVVTKADLQYLEIAAKIGFQRLSTTVVEFHSLAKTPPVF